MIRDEVDIDPEGVSTLFGISKSEMQVIAKMRRDDIHEMAEEAQPVFALILPPRVWKRIIERNTLLDLGMTKQISVLRIEETDLKYLKQAVESVDDNEP
ncbi:hypothetical protein [Methylohalobius crimeensis]|uniref:hypothetical protein n=1 Tax=Methylohalobius crimeensis TaxID=244365 RepID=UPI001F2B92CC|nr:hypothetical protein [Methylohalobius crimeensis]